LKQNKQHTNKACLVEKNYRYDYVGFLKKVLPNLILPNRPTMKIILRVMDFICGPKNATQTPVWKLVNFFLEKLDSSQKYFRNKHK